MKGKRRVNKMRLVRSGRCATSVQVWKEKIVLQVQYQAQKNIIQEQEKENKELKCITRKLQMENVELRKRLRKHEAAAVITSDSVDLKHVLICSGLICSGLKRVYKFER